MARMYSRRHGKSSSTKPESKDVPEWVSLSSQEITALISRFAKEGLDSSKIGLILRDQYGIPSVRNICGNTIAKLMEEGGNKPEIPADLLSLLKRIVFIKKHLEGNHKDQTARRGLRLTESKVQRLINFYQASKKLPHDWSYDLNKIRFLTE